jgi:hypothetical protein
VAVGKSDDPYADRKALTFEQAEGGEPLPPQLLPKQISKQLSAALWVVVYGYINKTLNHNGFENELGRDWSIIMYDHHVYHKHRPADEFSSVARLIIPKIKRVVLSEDYITVLGFLQFILRHPSCQPSFVDNIDRALRIGHAGYRIIERNTIIPIASETESQTLEAAFADLAAAEFHGARAHLRDAAVALTAGEFTSSVRESIHAVESVARTIGQANSLSHALGQLEKSAAIHGALKSGFLAIYGYTSDEQGIRHPLIDGPSANVDETDALFMIGACASFVSYLIGKARSAGLLKKKK